MGVGGVNLWGLILSDRLGSLVHIPTNFDRGVQANVGKCGQMWANARVSGGITHGAGGVNPYSPIHPDRPGSDVGERVSFQAKVHGVWFRTGLGQVIMNARNGKKAQDVEEPVALAPAQEVVIAHLLAGKTQADAAQEAGLRPEQVSRWKSDDPVFIAEFNRRTLELWESNRAELLDLAREARKTLRDLLTSENDSIRLRAAVFILNAQHEPARGLPTTPQAVGKELTRASILESLF